MMLQHIGNAIREQKAAAAARQREAARLAKRTKRRQVSEWLRDLADGLCAVLAVVFPFGF